MSGVTVISPPVRQILATMAYAGVVAGLLGGSMWLITDLLSRSGQLTAVSLRLDQFLIRLQQPPSKSLDDGAAVSLFLGGRTQTIAAAAFEQRVKDAVVNSGGVLTSSHVESDNPSGTDGFVRLTASLEVDQLGLQSTLYDIEAGTPYLYVDKLSIQSPEDFGDPEAGRFRMTLVVVGQWRLSN